MPTETEALINYVERKLFGSCGKLLLRSRTPAYRYLKNYIPFQTEDCLFKFFDQKIMSESVSVILIILLIAIPFVIFFIIDLVKYRGKKKNKVASKKTNSQTVSTPSNDRKIFLNYRKEDSSGYSLALYHELIRWYDKEIVFKDFNNIYPGEEFREAINEALNSCEILLIIIADKWLDLLKHRKDLAHTQDFVLLEISTALSKNIYTIPITINGAYMPADADLPDELKKLAHRQFLNIDQTRFETDTLKLVHIIDKRLGIVRNK